MSDLSITIDTREIEAFAEKMGASPEIVAAEMTQTMDASLVLLETNVVDLTPVNFGTLRDSIYHDVHGRPPDFWGEVAASALHGPPVEFGRKAGRWPPQAPIQLWARRKLGISDEKELKAAAFLIARHIGQYGTQPGAQMFQKGFAKSEGQINRLWDEVPDRIVERLAG